MRKYIALIALIAAFTLAGCATTPLDGSAKPARDTGAFAVATLAPFGSFEFNAAPGYTRLAVARRLTARRLDAGRVTVEHARQVQAAADRARGALDGAVSTERGGDKAKAQEQLADALKAVEAVDQLVQGAR